MDKFIKGDQVLPTVAKRRFYIKGNNQSSLEKGEIQTRRQKGQMPGVGMLGMRGTGGGCRHCHPSAKKQ